MCHSVSHKRLNRNRRHAELLSRTGVIVHHIGSGAVGKSRTVIALVKGHAFWLNAETTQVDSLRGGRQAVGGV